MYIFEVNNSKVGQIRLERVDDKCHLINYSIAKEYRGKGYATEMLRLIKHQYTPNLLMGKVKKDNIGSIKAFEKAGYWLVDNENGVNVYYSLNLRTMEGRQ